MFKSMQLLTLSLWIVCLSMLSSFNAMAQVGGEAELRYKKIQEHKMCREGCTESYRKSATSVDGSTVMSATQACLQNCDRLIDGTQSTDSIDFNYQGPVWSFSRLITTVSVLLLAIAFYRKRRPENFSILVGRFNAARGVERAFFLVGMVWILIYFQIIKSSVGIGFIVLPFISMAMTCLWLYLGSIFFMPNIEYKISQDVRSLIFCVFSFYVFSLLALAVYSPISVLFGIEEEKILTAIGFGLLYPASLFLFLNASKDLFRISINRKLFVGLIGTTLVTLVVADKSLFWLFLFINVLGCIVIFFSHGSKYRYIYESFPNRVFFERALGIVVSMVRRRKTTT